MLKVAVFMLVAPCRASMPMPSDVTLWQMFSDFQLLHRKGLTGEDRLNRFAAFKTNVEKAIALNNKHGSECTDLFADCPYGITRFSDMTPVEFKARMTGLTFDNSSKRLQTMPASAYEKGLSVTSKDWRAEGKVSAIKDQNPCGVCWAFSATGTIESAYAIKYDTSPPVLSPEMIIDCDGTHKCNGNTSGGIYTQAWEWLEKEGGLASLEEYPITCCDETPSPVIGKCPASRKHDVKVTGYNIGPSDERELAAAVATQGPFSIAVAADAWSSWKGGKEIMKVCPGEIDHAVAIVGFNKDAPTPYWIVRNQWGTQWGDEGYVYLAYGNNTCKLTTLPAIAEVSKPTETEPMDVIV